MENGKKYYAFISYKREDEKWAKWLQNKLEHYKLPSNLNGRTNLPKEIRPIFRDQSELAAGVLADEINKALTNSKYLIVICSPRAAQSQWVGKEVQTFIDLGRTDRIIPFIIGGTAHAQNMEDECFPLALLKLPPEQELLGINVDEMGRDAAAVKVVAQMFGLGFDALWQRYEKERRRKQNNIVCITVALVLVALGITGWILWQNIRIRQQNTEIAQKSKELELKEWKKMENWARFVAEKARKLNDEGDPFTAQRILLEVLPTSLKQPNIPFVVESEAALRNAINYNRIIFESVSQDFMSASFSPDGKRIVSASWDGKIIVWDVETRTEMLDFWAMLHLTSATFSPDGKRIISSGCYPVVEIWDVETGDRIMELDGHEDYVSSASYSLDCRCIVTTSSLDNTIRIWDAESGKEIMKLDAKDVESASYSPDGERIVSGYGDGTIRVFDATNGMEILRFKGHSDLVNSVVYSPNGKCLVSASYDESVKIWDAETGKEKMTLEGHQGRVRSASYSSDGKRIVSASEDETTIIWNAETGEMLYVFGDNSGVVFSAVFSPDGSQVVTASSEINVWNAKTEVEILLLDDHPTSVKAVFSPDGSRIASASERIIRIWDVKTRSEIMRIENPSWFKTISYSHDGKRIAAVVDKTIVVLDAEMGAELLKLEGHPKLVESAVFSPDGKHIASSSIDGTIRIWDANTGMEIMMFEGHEDWISSVSYSPDGKRIVSASQDETIIVWDAETGKVIMKKDVPRGNAYSALYCPDGSRILSVSGGLINIWDSETGQEILKFEIPADYICSASYSPDGKYVVTAATDNTVRVFDSETGVEVLKLEGHLWCVESAMFSPDGEHIVSAADEYTIRIWPFPPLQDLIDQTRERFKDRPLTPEERRQYCLE